MTLIYLVAGEASGDVLGARLIAAIRGARPDATFAGVGGPTMAGLGFNSLFPMGELSLMGLLEVVPKLLAVRRRIAQTAKDIAAQKPAIVVTIDSPGFCLRLLRAIEPLGIPRAHYVAPQAWAWRERRVRAWPGLWERLLCLLPFEPAFFERHGIEARFVGHPVLESGAAGGDGERFRVTHALAPAARVLTVMPGSRMGEIGRHMPLFGATVARLAETRADLSVVVPVAPMVADAVRQMAAGWPTPPLIVVGESQKHDAFAASTAALSKSGTSTLELAVAGVPTVVTYQMNPLTVAVARRVIRVRHASIVNLLARTEIMPELLQEHGTPQTLAAALAPLLDDPAAAQAQRAAAAPVLASLRAPGGVAPSVAAAREVLGLLDRPRPPIR